MKILIMGPREMYEAYKPDFVDQMPVELVFRRREQSLVDAAREHPDAQIMFIDSMTEVGAEVMDELPRLQMIQLVGVAYNGIDAAAARERGIFVCNNQGCNAEAVAEHAIMLMLMALRCGISGHTAVVEGRQIEKKLAVIAARKPGLYQCSVGLIGFGNIAQAAARRLAAFGCELYYYTAHRRSPEVEADFGVTYLPLKELLKTCDIVSLHCDVNSETRGMVNADFLAAMKPTAILVNSSRGALVENEALRAALVEGRIACAALDSFDPEPTPANHPLVDLPEEARERAIYSPHLGGSSSGAFSKAHETMWKNVQRLLDGERPVFVTNGI